ncbi:hypothetical protein DFJ43DRAFT_634558 [Lentinula guzmanii]|uniref:Uncharacterized protein n=1 Tax=Lentinula guzmanii TaxID=2804957 RepID=A0AA38MS73_9AGAR|nr:hypothetical protein DFJ43DRAFT_634558 [Lentinula guzmanii]
MLPAVAFFFSLSNSFCKFVQTPHIAFFSKLQVILLCTQPLNVFSQQTPQFQFPRVLKYVFCFSTLTCDYTNYLFSESISLLYLLPNVFLTPILEAARTG